MRNSSNAPSLYCTDGQRQPLGSYLIEAGLLTTAQVDVALNDQKLTGMRFGEVLAARGWVKEQTIEYFVHKVIVPDRQSAAQVQRLQALEQLQLQVQEQAQKNAHEAAQRQACETAQEFVPEHPYADALVTRSRPPAAPAAITRRDVPISKPLPSVPSGDGDVSWVG